MVILLGESGVSPLSLFSSNWLVLLTVAPSLVKRPPTFLNVCGSQRPFIDLLLDLGAAGTLPFGMLPEPWGRKLRSLNLAQKCVHFFSTTHSVSHRLRAEFSLLNSLEAMGSRRLRRSSLSPPDSDASIVLLP